MLSSGAWRDEVLTACAREVWLFAANVSCQVTILNKPGGELILADALSRRDFDLAARNKAASLCPKLKLRETWVDLGKEHRDGL